jgi:hypothetical protein
MTNIENTHNETPDAYSDIFSFFSATSIGILYQLSPFLLSKENQALLDELVGKAKVELIGFLDRAESRLALEQQIEHWRNQKADPKQTRVIIKIINNTPHSFKMAQTSLPLRQSERESFQLMPQEETAFKSEFAYTYAYPWPKNKIMFNQFIDFGDKTIGVRFDLGMIMNTSFGVITPTHKPSVKNTVTSIGTSRVNCSTKITHMSDEAPFNFEVEITLG